ncbi:MAG: glycosyl hydrolase [Verrucomicrobiae bacterium]|nr:glycosyl hydrolase [Verrucomicrobiae bacterium]
MTRPSRIELYPKSRTPFRADLFANPPAEYRGYPFWCWNTKMERKHLRQIGYFQEMGMGGMTIHCRTGLETPYMGPEFMELVRGSVAEAKKRGMFVWLYDEDRWPSGYGGGMVTKDPAFRARHLLLTPRPYDSSEKAPAEVRVCSAGTGRTGNGVLLAVYDVVLDSEGVLKNYRQYTSPPARPRGTLWYAYLETAIEQTWFNHQTYVDTLNPRAIERFIETTHDVYKDSLKQDFGRTVPAIFTDEPQFAHKYALPHAFSTEDVVIPITGDFFETYAREYAQRLEAHIPELFWELPGFRPSLARYRYHDHLAERFASAYADTLGRWCENNGIALTGHMMEEPTLESQTHALGEAMRSYRGFHVPGIDILCDHHPESSGQRIEFTTAKQAQSACRQYGRSGVMSELYGVTNWDFTFAGHKAQGDWQAALGVTVRVHHLAWVSMAGEAKRDYPASIFYQSPWHSQYRLVENHFARVNAALTRGVPRVRVGVIHPIESYWLSYGPQAQTRDQRAEQETRFQDLTTWLVHDLCDWDFICESLLPSLQPRQEGRTFQVGRMAYEVVVVPSMRTLRPTTVERLESFVQAGGRVIFAGEIPSLVGAVASDRVRRLSSRCERIEWGRIRLRRALEPLRDFGVYDPDGHLADGFAAQIRQDGKNRYVFVCNTARGLGCDGHPYGNDFVLRFRGCWEVEEMNTLTGKIRSLPSVRREGWTELPWHFAPIESLLLRLKPAKPLVRAVPPAGPVSWSEVARVADPVRVTLSEPNVLLLDRAAWRLGRGPWQDPCELLRLEAGVRQKLGLPAKDFAIAQPWTDTAPAPVAGELTLRFEIRSQVRVVSPKLAMEKAALARLHLEGREVPVRIGGWWVDECLQTVTLPTLRPGRSVLEITIPFTRKTDLEYVYLLGDFGVRVAGSHSTIIEPVRTLAWGDWCPQGLPFYAGNLTYHAAFDVAAPELALEIPHFRGPLITARLGAGKQAPIAFPPYRWNLGRVGKGRKKLDLTVYGNRFNAFGNIHYSGRFHWSTLGAPTAYRATHFDWSDQYRLRPMGILVAPMLTVASVKQVGRLRSWTS